MAGKKGKSGGARPGTGGAMPGAGRKSLVISDTLRQKIAEEIAASDQEHGKSMWRALADIAHGVGEGIRPSDQIAAAKTLMQSQLVKEDYSTVETITHAAPMLLPVLQDDPGTLDDTVEPIKQSEDVH